MKGVNMDTNKTCPVCGSEDIIEKKIRHILAEPFGGSLAVGLNEDRCNTCDTRGDFQNVNDAKVDRQLEELRAAAVKNILQDFADHNYSFASMERALELPQRTLTKWKKTGKSAAAGLSLLRLLRIFPWLLEVADNHFDFQNAQKICASASFKIYLDDCSFQDSLSSPKTQKSAGPFVFHSENNVNIQQNIFINNGEESPSLRLI